jgi:hypothetical protein
LSSALFELASTTLYNQAACYKMLEQYNQAPLLLKRVLERGPENEPAQRLLAECRALASTRL